MKALDDIKLYLPKFLSASSEKELLEQLSSFPDNINQNFYSDVIKRTSSIYQGDGIAKLPSYNFIANKKMEVKGIIVSNTCDIAEENKRYFNSMVSYAPIFKLQKYKELLYKMIGQKKQSIDAHIQSIREQKITQIFFIPPTNGISEECFARIDSVVSIPKSSIEGSTILDNRLFCLSNYGFYLFLFKLSINFTRIRDGVDRDAS